MLLFVDDDAAFRRSIASYARSQKRRIALAANAEEAWATLMAHDDIDAIVCDLRMPGGGAIDLLRRARKINPGLRCTLLTVTPDDPTVSALSAKMKDLNFLYEQFIAFLEQDWISPRQRLEQIVQRIALDPDISAGRVFVDGFHDFTQQERSILVALAQPGLYWMNGNTINVDGGEAIAG